MKIRKPNTCRLLIIDIYPNFSPTCSIIFQDIFTLPSFGSTLEPFRPFATIGVKGVFSSYFGMVLRKNKRFPSLYIFTLLSISLFYPFQPFQKENIIVKKVDISIFYGRKGYKCTITKPFQTTYAFYLFLT